MAGGEGSPQTPESRYSSLFALAYIFNLIMGVGALALPRAFSESGLILGTLLIVILAFMSFMTTTYVVEAMAAANAYSIFREQEKSQKLTRQSSDIQKGDLEISDRVKEMSMPLVPHSFQESSPDCYEIEKKFEWGTMASMFYHPVGVILYYICICTYLYGNVSIYIVTIAKSLRTVTCSQGASFTTNGFNISNNSDFYTDLRSTIETNTTSFNSTAHNHHHCFRSSHVNEMQTYYIYLAITVIFLCPWTFLNLTCSKYLQLFTTVLRNIAFFLMVLLGIIDLASGHRADPLPPAARLEGFPVLFGVSIYSFMCHHSLPGVITPMKSKKNVFWLTLTDFSLVLVFYLLLSYTGAFRFALNDLQDLYTLNFFNQSAMRVTLRVVLGYYLALFPVFTLTTNFPIISITLRENLKALFCTLFKRWYGDKEFHVIIERTVFSLLAVIPPILIAFATTNVEVLVSVTGSFAGVGVQYVIPATMAFAGKYAIKKKYKKYENKHRSPFSYLVFLIFVLAWTVISVVLTIVNDALKIEQGTFAKAQ